MPADEPLNSRRVRLAALEELTKRGAAVDLHGMSDTEESADRGVGLASWTSIPPMMVPDGLDGSGVGHRQTDVDREPAHDERGAFVFTRQKMLERRAS
jgi:hypothetical protein